MFPAGKQEDCLIQPEEFKYLKFFFRSVINWCCDTDGKSKVAPAVMQVFFLFFSLQTNAVKPQRKVLSVFLAVFFWGGAEVEP